MDDEAGKPSQGWLVHDTLLLVSLIIEFLKICRRKLKVEARIRSIYLRAVLRKQYNSPSAGAQTMYYHYDWKGVLYVTCIENSNGFWGSPVCACL